MSDIKADIETALLAVAAYVADVKATMLLRDQSSVGKYADAAGIMKNALSDITNMDITAALPIDKIAAAITIIRQAVLDDRITTEAVADRSFTYAESVQKKRETAANALDKIDADIAAAPTLIASTLTAKTAEAVETYMDSPTMRNIFISLVSDNANIRTMPWARRIIGEMSNKAMQGGAITAAAAAATTTWHRGVSASSGGNSINVATGQNVEYNLRGVVSGEYVASNRLGEPLNHGITKTTITRLSTMTAGEPTPVDISYDPTAKKISYGATWGLSVIPGAPRATKASVYSAIVGNNIIANIRVVEPLDEDLKAKEDAAARDIMSQLRSRTSKAGASWATQIKNSTSKPDNIDAMVDDLMTALAPTIKEAVFARGDDIDGLISSMGLMTDIFHRIRRVIYKSMVTRDKTAEAMVASYNWEQIIEAAISAAVIDVDRQPSLITAIAVGRVRDATYAAAWQ